MTRLRAAPSRQPRAWEELITQVTAAPDRPTALRGILELQCRIVAAQYGLFWEPGPEGAPVATISWPMADGSTALAEPVLKMLQQAARTALERGTSQVLRVEPAEGSGPMSSDTYVFVTALRAEGQCAAVVTVVAEVRDTQVITITTPQREIAASLYENVLARQRQQSAELEAQRVRQAMALLAVVQDGRGFSGSCLNLVNELARSLKAERVSLGWIRGRNLKLKAVSDSEEVKHKGEQAALLEMAMAECLDQQQPIMCPLPESAEPALAHAVVYGHRRLIEGQSQKQVVSVPLRHGEEWVGVLTIERCGDALDAGDVQRLQLIADVIAPQLADRRASDRWLGAQAWESCKWTAGKLVGPKHVGWKLAGAAVLVAVLYVLLATWPFRVTASFRLEAMQRQVVPAPFRNKLDELLVHPDDVVHKGQVLARLDTTDLAIQLAGAQKQLEVARIQRDQALGDPSKHAEAELAQAQADEYQAQVDLLQYQIRQATIRSPVDGVVLNSYWEHRVGSVVDQDQPMFEVAPQGDVTAVLRVSEGDVRYLLDREGRMRRGLVGELATRSEPEQTFPIHVERIVPLAQPVDGKNVFEVWCGLDRSAPWFRPGMEGMAKVDVGREPLSWILTHKIVDAVRLWMWW